MNRRKYIEYVVCGCCGFFIQQCSTVPITERRQFSIIPESTLNNQAAQVYEKINRPMNIENFAPTDERGDTYVPSSLKGFFSNFPFPFHRGYNWRNIPFKKRPRITKDYSMIFDLSFFSFFFTLLPRLIFSFIFEYTYQNYKYGYSGKYN